MVENAKNLFKRDTSFMEIIIGILLNGMIFVWIIFFIQKIEIK